MVSLPGVFLLSSVVARVANQRILIRLNQHIVSACKETQVCTCALRVYVCTHAHMYEYATHVRMYVCTNVRMYVCTYVK